MTTDNGLSSPAESTRVLLVDDHPLVRRGLADVIAREPDLEICGEAGDVAEALAGGRAHQARPGGGRPDAQDRPRHRTDREAQGPRSDVKTLVSSMHDEMLFAERVLRAGAMGYVTKQEPPETLLRAIRQVLRGEVYLSPRMTSRLLHRVAAGTPTQENPVQSLSNRELEVYEMIGQGLTIQQIATPPASQPEDDRNPPREDQAEAQRQEQRRTEPPRRAVGAGARLKNAG